MKPTFLLVNTYVPYRIDTIRIMDAVGETRIMDRNEGRVGSTEDAACPDRTLEQGNLPESGARYAGFGNQVNLLHMQSR